jgi:pimeloyl-ACP methyl ester carboxylesterase
VLERLVATLRSELGLADEAFDLWGHSAGAQFAHRFALFRPAAPVRRIVAAGAGWYTTPDLELDFPYGLRHEQLGFDRLALERWTRRDNRPAARRARGAARRAPAATGEPRPKAPLAGTVPRT